MRACTLPLPAACLGLAVALPAAVHAQVPTTLSGPDQRPDHLTVIPVLGDETTAQPTPLIANLDAGDLVAGRTWWEFDRDIVYVETYLGFTWSPEHGIDVHTVPLTLYFQDLLTYPAGIAPDRTVAGTMTSTTSFESWPYRWTPSGGVEFLVQPGTGQGSAATVSADGRVIGGSIRASIFAAPEAARWVAGALDVLGPPGFHSYVTAGSSDGSVLVGDVGTSAADVQATRWIDGAESPLAAVPGASTSSALFVSDDGGTVVGTATVGGERLLARWTPDGAVTTYAPPPGLGVEEVNATNPDASAVVGALSDDPTAFQGNWVPFRWRPSDGFTLIDELGLPDEYDLSEATDVSDDGTRVIGELGHWVFGPGSTPGAAFLWTEAEGTRDLDQVQAEISGEELGFHAALAMSGDGRRILVDGVPAPSPQDSNAVILAFSAAP